MIYPASLPDYITDFFSEKENFRERVSKLVHISVHQDCNVGMHHHDFYEINIVVNGTGCHYIGNMAIPLVSGEVFAIPPKVKHGYYCVDRLDVCHILLRSDFVNRYFADMARVPGFTTLFEIEPYLRQVYDKHCFLRLDKSSLENVRVKIANIMHFHDGKYDMFQAFFVLDFLSELCCEMDCQERRRPEEKDSDIFRVLEYIQDHYSDKITIADLMHVSHLSRATLHRRFKNVTQEAPMVYIINRRLEAVKTHYRESGESRTAVAQKYGFYDTSHLNKLLHGKRKQGK